LASSSQPTQATSTQSTQAPAGSVPYFDGNQVAYGGRVYGGVQTLASGRFYTGCPAAQHNTDLAFVNQRQYANYFPVVRETLFVGIGINIGTGEAGKIARLGIYTDSGGVPNALVLDAGTVSIASTGEATAVISQWLAPGMYQVSCTTDATGTAEYVSVQSTFEGCLGGVSGTAALAQYCYDTSIDPSSALPDPFGSVLYSTGRKPWIYLEVD